MAKKNFDAFINSAGKKRKPTPEEVEEMAKQIHQPLVETPIEVAKPIPKKTVKPKAKTTRASLPKAAKSSRNLNSSDAPKEKVRITIDLAKDLYKRMKLSVVQNETEISAYVRLLIENDLASK